ncbi:MAG: hypothetical protein ACK6CE_15735 [Planctomycetota bacterium]
MAIRQIGSLLFQVMVLACCWEPLSVFGQSELPPIVPANSPTEEFPARRSFPSLPLNDLRSPAVVPSSNSQELQPQFAPPNSPPAAVVAPAQAGTTSGVFLQPQAAPSANNAPLNRALNPALNPVTPSASDPAATALQDPARSRPLGLIPERVQEQNREPAAQPLSRPVELISEPLIQDNQVRLASGIESGIGLPNQLSRGPAGGSMELARQLLERYDVQRAPDPLPGRPIRLEDALQNSPPERRRAIVRQYWQTYAAWASYLNRCERCNELARLHSGSDLQQSQLLENSRLLAEDERLQAEIRLQWAQQELGGLIPSAGSELLPLPADQPLAQAYETHSDWYVANGSLPPQLQTIARALPKQLQLLQHRALTAEAAMNGANRSGGQLGSGLQDLPTQLAAIALAGQAQQAFLQSVVDYNQWIADYSLSISPAGQNSNSVAAMLVAPRRPLLETTPAALVQGMRGAAGSRVDDRPRLTTEPTSVIEPQGFAPQRQPIERVSGSEPAWSQGERALPVVTPAFGGSGSGAAPQAGTGLTPPSGAPASFAPPPSAEKFQPQTGNAAGAGNSAPVGGSFSPPGSFTPPPKIPSFDSPQPQPTAGQPPAQSPQPLPLTPFQAPPQTPPQTPPGSGGTGFKLGG